MSYSASSRGARHILLVDDDPGVLMFVGSNLRRRGHRVTTAQRGDEALQMLSCEHPDLVVLDLTLPTMDGIEVLRHARGWTGTPVIVLSGRGEERTKVQALDLGADDYLTKPFGIEELLARIRVALRRSDALHDSADEHLANITIGDLHIDPARRQVHMQGQEIQLTPTEYDLLRCLVQHAGKVLTHRDLLQKVWGPEYGRESEYLRTFVKNLRRKLGDEPAHPRYILTIPGVGYRLIAPDEFV